MLIAAVPRWADWFLAFWSIDEDRIDYLAAMRPVDPIEHIGRAAPAKSLLQFARADFFIAQMTGLEFKRAAGEAAELKAYDAEHDMAVPDALSPIGPRFSRRRWGRPPSRPSPRPSPRPRPQGRECRQQSVDVVDRRLGVDDPGAE